MMPLNTAASTLEIGQLPQRVGRSIPIYSNIYPTRCNFTQFILSGNCSTCFAWYLRPSSGAQTTVPTTSGICHTVTATCRCRGKAGKLNS